MWTLPPGFANVGVAGAAGGAGISTGVLLGIGAAAGVAGIAVAGVVNGDIIMLELGIPGGGPSLILPGTISGDTMGGTDPEGGGGWELSRL
jgi:hypothetical protein